MTGPSVYDVSGPVDGLGHIVAGGSLGTGRVGGRHVFLIDFAGLVDGDNGRLLAQWKVVL